MSWKQGDPVEDKASVDKKTDEPQKDVVENKGQESKPDVTDPKKDQNTEADDKIDAKTDDSKGQKTEDESDEMVSRKVLGQVAKKIRERGKSELAEAQRQIQALAEENEKLRKGEQPPEPLDEKSPEAIRQSVLLEFLKRQDEYGRKKYGEEHYKNAALLIQTQNDPVLIKKIQESATPADTMVLEAQRIAEELQYGDDPKERDKNKEAALKAKIRKEVEAELAEKLKVLGNQTTDVSKVRSAGSENKPKNISSWETSLK